MQNVVDTKLSIKFYGDSKGYPTVGYGHLITSKEKYNMINH